MSNIVQTIQQCEQWEMCWHLLEISAGAVLHHMPADPQEATIKRHSQSQVCLKAMSHKLPFPHLHSHSASSHCLGAPLGRSAGTKFYFTMQQCSKIKNHHEVRLLCNVCQGGRSALFVICRRAHPGDQVW